MLYHFTIETKLSLWASQNYSIHSSCTHNNYCKSGVGIPLKAAKRIGRCPKCVFFVIFLAMNWCTYLHGLHAFLDEWNPQEDTSTQTYMYTHVHVRKFTSTYIVHVRLILLHSRQGHKDRQYMILYM